MAYNGFAMTSNPFRDIPSVDSLLAHASVVPLGLPHETMVALCREAIDGARIDIRAGSPSPGIDGLAQRIVENASALLRPRPRRVINATGVIIHTNLGRAPLSHAAMDAAQVVALGYSDLEFDLESGERGSRHTHIEGLLTQLTGAEAAIAVNNNASALLLALAALADGQDVVVSRGEAVEIGGRFRIPDVLRQSGAHLVEVGTTNRTYVTDYADALTESTAAFLKVHTSNFAQIGFTESVEVEALAPVARERNVLLLNDLGSGCLLDTSAYSLAPEPTVQDSVARGASLSLFSGDKLLGGPQAGIAVGDKAVIDKLKGHPLARAVRMDKMTLAALTATLLHYLKGEAESEIPVWRMISATMRDVSIRADAWAGAVGKGAEVIDTESTIGGGSLPGQTLATRALAIPEAPAGEAGLDDLARRFREADTPVIGRIADGRLILDPRSVLPEEDEAVVQAIRFALGM